MKNQKWLLTLAVFIAASTTVRADAVDEVIRKAMTDEHLPSVSVMIGRRGVILKKAAYGQASLELHVPATTNTVYPIASATKPFTSSAIMMLVAKGSFSLEDPITKLLPDLPSSWADVTVHHLLTHTSGLPDIAIKPGREPLIAATRAEALTKLATMPRQFATAEKWSYNQTNYMLLLMLIEKFSGKPFQSFIEETQFKPFEMKATVFGDSDDVVDGRASTYEYRDSAMHPSESHFPEFVRGAAGVNTSVTDWYRWVDAWAHGKVISRKALEILWTPAVLSSGDMVHLGKTMTYGGGLLIDPTAGHRSVGHSGGGTAAFRYFIDDDMVVVVETNGKTNPDKLIESIAKAVPAP